MNRPRFAIVTTTIDREDAATALAHALVETRLAACVHISPIRSIYRWEGAIEDAKEVQLVCKIAVEDFSKVRAAIESRHSYDVPEIVMTPIEDGSERYLAWLTDETREASA